MTEEAHRPSPTRTSEPDRSGAAFFDVDRTLISGSSSFALALAAWRSGLVSPRELLIDASSAVIFRLLGASEERSEATRDRILNAVAGHSVDELVSFGRDVVPQLLAKIRPEAKSLLDMHADRGRDRWIVSASPHELISRLADSLALEGGVGTRSEIVNGRYTGRLDGPFVYADGKAQAVATLARERGYDLRVCYAYSDSFSDLPMLELVGHPVAVNPDRSLESVARQRGWPVVEFRRTVKRVVKTTTAVTGAAGLATATYALGRRHGRLAAGPTRSRLLTGAR